MSYALVRKLVRKAVIMTISTNLLMRNGVYYFRIHIPIELSTFLGKAEIKKSLKTRCLRTAKCYASYFNIHVSNTFAILISMKEQNAFITKDMAIDFLDKKIKHFTSMIHNNPRSSEYFNTGKMIDKSIINGDYSHWGSELNTFLESKADNLQGIELEEAQKVLMFIMKEAHTLSDDYSVGNFDIKPKYDLVKDYSMIPDVLGKSSYKTPDAISVQGNSDISSGISMYEVLDRYIESIKQDALNGQIRDDTVKECSHTYNLWKNIIKNKDISSVDKKDCREFRDKIAKLPARYNIRPQYREESIESLLKLFIPQEDIVATKTVNKNISWLKLFFNWAINEGYYKLANPVLGLKLKDKTKARDARQPFSGEDLIKYFECPIYKGSRNSSRGRMLQGDIIIKDSVYWIPLIALYTGARLNEIYQLRKSDIIEIGGVYVFNINDDDGKLIKNENSKRIIPIHPVLLDLGILEYIIEQKDELFTDISSESALSKRFSRYLCKLDMKDKRKSFHSLRHTFIDALRKASIPDAVAYMLTGHSDGGKKANYDYGSDNSQILFDAISKVEYPIDL